MKLSFLHPAICAVAAASVWSSAALADYPYVKLNIGRTFSDATVTDRTEDFEATANLDVASGFAYGVAVGADLALSPKWAQFAWEAEFALRDANVTGAEISGSVPGGFVDGADIDAVTTYSMLGNIWWRPAIFGQVRPYLGGGAGAAYLPEGGLSTDDIYALAYQLGGGVDYEFSNGMRAGVGMRHFSVSANDRDDTDPLFTFETQTELSETTVFAAATVPFAIFSNRYERAPSAVFNQDTARERQMAKAERKAAALKKDAEKRARIAREKQTKKAAKAARLAAAEDEKRTGFLNKINPFYRKKPALREPGPLHAAAPDALPTAAPKTAAAPSRKPTRVAMASANSISAPIGKTSAGPTQPLRYGAYFAQLGAYSTERMARDIWGAKTARQPDLLKGAAHQIIRHQPPSQSKALYLLRVGPHDKSSAQALCKLVEHDCIVVGG